jgi:hypothetical protein
MSEYVDSDDRTTQEITFEVTAYIVADDGSPTPGGATSCRCSRRA